MGILTALFWEIRMSIQSTIRYRFGVISDVIIYSAILSFFLLSNSGQSYAEMYENVDYKIILVIGYLAWMYAVTAITSISQIVSGEMKQGTFYKKYNAKYPLQILLFGRLVAALVVQSIVMLAVIIIAMLIGNVSMIWEPVIIVAIVISTVGMYGIGLILAGMSIFYKKIGAFNYLIQLFLLFITDTLPTSENISSISKILPLTSCNFIIKKALDQQNYIDEFVLLCISSLVFLFIGYMIFEYFLLKARKKGNLLFYWEDFWGFMLSVIYDSMSRIVGSSIYCKKLLWYNDKAGIGRLILRFCDIKYKDSGSTDRSIKHNKCDRLSNQSGGWTVWRKERKIWIFIGVIYTITVVWPMALEVWKMH